MTPNPEHLLQFFLILSLLAGIAGVLWKFFAKPRKQEIAQPLAVREWKEFATKEELEKLERKFTGEFACLQTGMNALRTETIAAGEKRTDKLMEKLDAMQAESKADRKLLYARLNDSDKALARLEGKFEERKK